jgi:hypothetical protein
MHRLSQGTTTRSSPAHLHSLSPIPVTVRTCAFYFCLRHMATTDDIPGCIRLHHGTSTS